MELEMEIPPMSLREIQAQGGKILPTIQSPKRKLKKQIYPKICGIDDSMSRLLPINFLSKRCLEPERLAHRFEEQLAASQRTSDILDEQVKILRDENGEMKGFIRDILYTLNARGYESITDKHGGVIDLNRCRGEHFLELKGRDARARQCPTKRIQAQEHLLKAVIGSQEKLIRNLIGQIQTNKRNDMIGTRLTSASASCRNGGVSCDETENEKSALLEREILALVTSLESAIERYPSVYTGLKEQMFFETAHSGSGNGILAAVLARHQLTTESSSGSRGDESRPRTPNRRKVYLDTLKRNSDEGSLGSKVFATTIGTLRDKLNHQQRHPSSTGIRLKHSSSVGDEDRRDLENQFVLRPMTSKCMISSSSPPLSPTLGHSHSRRPATSFNEYSSFGMSRKSSGKWS